MDDRNQNAEENQKTVEPEQTVDQELNAAPDNGVESAVQAPRPEPAEPVQAQETEPVQEQEPDVEPDALEIGAPAGEEPAASAPPAAPATPAKPEETKRAWYVVHCYSGYENKVKKSLEQRITNMDVDGLIFRIIVPTEEEIDVREGQRKVIQRRVFPGYVLVEMMQYDPENPESKRAWYVVRNTPGVTGFVSSGDIPTPLREDEVSKILKRMETDQPKVRVTYRKGQAVHIIDGPFADFRGTVDEVNMEKGKVRVMVSFFGRDTPVELDLLQVEKV
ncbi:MAG TPA: transcription termination/antitermination protein NusG [Anaerolineae bacterium]